MGAVDELEGGEARSGLPSFAYDGIPFQKVQTLDQVGEVGERSREKVTKGAEFDPAHLLQLRKQSSSARKEDIKSQRDCFQQKCLNAKHQLKADIAKRYEHLNVSLARSNFNIKYHKVALSSEDLIQLLQGTQVDSSV